MFPSNSLFIPSYDKHKSEVTKVLRFRLIFGFLTRTYNTFVLTCILIKPFYKPSIIEHN